MKYLQILSRDCKDQWGGMEVIMYSTICILQQNQFTTVALENNKSNTKTSTTHPTIFYLPIFAPFRQSTIRDFNVQVVVVQHSSPTNVLGICQLGLDI